MNKGKILSACGVSAGYGKNNILHDISFSVGEHEVVGLLGANGCGKTTLLKSICRIIPYNGTVEICGQNLRQLSAKQLARLCSYIPQRSGISIDISALDVVLMGFNPELRILETPNAAMRERAMKMLSLVGLENRAQENYSSFSEGQKQLCILARSMVRECRLMLMDEPESALDFGGRYLMLDAVKNVTVHHPCSALVTLHDPQLALNICTRILLVKNGEIVSEIEPEINDLSEMEERLAEVYGPLSVHLCKGKNGKDQLVLIKE
ncbi:MAG: ABC transporter ATP-binding protein [Oscillospiraceae bacterium]|nr:ABC transporter ATP-binding protein [Oscillospiraceae bacterium]